MQSIPAPDSLLGRCMVECGIYALHHASSPNFHTNSLRCLCLHAGCGMYLIGRVYSAISYSHSLFFRCPFAEQLVENNGTECRRTDATKRETADIDGEVASTHREGNCRRHQVTALGEVHVILHPDATPGGSNQAKEHNGKPAEHA